MIKSKMIIMILFLIVLIFNGFFSFLTNFYTEFLWFNSLHFSEVFLSIFKARIGIGIIGWMFFALFFFVNLNLSKNETLKLIDKIKRKKDNNVVELNSIYDNGIYSFFTKKRISLTYFIISALVAIPLAKYLANNWSYILKYFNHISFADKDPLFNLDLSYYIFRLPIYNLVNQILITSVAISLLLVGSLYILTKTGSSILKEISTNNKAYAHLSILLALFFVLRGYSYHLSKYDLLYSSQGAVFGAGYTDVTANLMGLRIMTVAMIIFAITILINIIIKKPKIIIIGFISLIALNIGVNNIYPQIIQRYRVEPNEIAMEREFIGHNIEFTRKAYNLDIIEERDFEINNELTYESILKNQGTIDNIRLWDTRPLISTYDQLQGIRSYYSFNDIDVDRYHINGKLRQVMLGARELDQSRLSSQAQSWVNKRLNYTHGFGIAMNPVNEVTEGGLPEFIIKDIPPKSDYFNISQPRIYYGELTSNYVIANTTAKEFDYPQGDTNQHYNYTGNGGVELSSFIRKSAFALKYNTLKIILNDNITRESRILFDRNIKERANKIAPFLSYDQDPYLVINDEGRLFWIQDAYTTTNRYPYSKPQRWGNYIRNSVKVVTDAYNGDVKFYIIDEEDPIVMTYNNIFPDLFTSIEDMPDDIRSHLRYPVDLFKIQADIYTRYHITNPEIFYNEEDLWELPQEKYAGTSIIMEPYYTLMNLPGEEEENFILMLPFTPIRRNNMIAWLAARSDPNNYGELILYNFPKQELVYGPMQIETRIDQDDNISQQLSLWNQRGSRVIRGNLLVIPVESSILYVEPIYLQAEQSELPELRRVIVAYGERIAMERTLEEALKSLFDIKINEEIKIAEDRLEESKDKVNIMTVKDLVDDINRLYLETQEELRRGNWQSYGELLSDFEDKLNRLKDKVQ
ncbi:UPF0182 family protein [Halonatronum saccharophilum]|uniref:UPF0182 family membrane protein n=1 Tax=Halonatronum saccharophilum TaxID=150060 RepID=UPI000A00AAB3|nr:UPF0182 family protein [Halonatronum saccharophilum]